MGGDEGKGRGKPLQRPWGLRRNHVRSKAARKTRALNVSLHKVPKQGREWSLGPELWGENPQVEKELFGFDSEKMD